MSSASRKTSSSTLPNIFGGWSAPAPRRDEDGLPVPDEGHVYFGADPAWSPAREAWSDTRRPLICPRCGREGEIKKGVAEVCACCGRYGFDHRVEAARRQEDYRNGQPVNEPVKHKIPDRYLA